MSSLTLFSFQNQNIRVLGTPENPWFVAKDICNILEIKNASDTLSRLDDEDKGYIVLTDPTGNDKNYRTINESGFYTLVLGSKKEVAKPFKRWVTKEVLPSIRKTGKYEVQQQNKPKISKALKAAREVREITDTLDDNPRLAQYLIDHAVSECLEQPLPALPGTNEPQLRGVVEIAEEMGFSVTLKNRSSLGKFVKKILPDLSQFEKRLVNGTMRAVNCYPDNEEVRNAISQFFS